MLVSVNELLPLNFVSYIISRLMNKRFLPVLFILFKCIESFAQIAVGPTEFFEAGQVSPIRIAYSWNGNPGPTGKNVVYDFLNATVGSKDTIRYWDIQQSAFAAYLPGSQSFRDYGGNPRFLSAYTQDANALWQSATIVIGNFGSGWDTLYGVNDPSGRDTLLSTLFKYGYTKTEHSKVDVIVNPNVYARFRSKHIINVDGEGLLYTPMGSFDSVLRINIWTFHSDSVFVNGNLDNATYDTTHDYWFIAKGYRIPAAVLHMNKNEKIWYMELAEVPFYIYGCTDTASLNYNPIATWDDGSCEYCNPLTYSVSSDTTVCAGATLTLRVIGGNRWKWSTGDTSQSITVIADSTRNYGVYVSGQPECWDLANIKVTVLQIAKADFWVDKTNASSVDTVQFVNLSNNATDYLWNFDDVINGTSTLSNPKHLYSTPGIKQVSLIASNNCSSDTFSTYLFLTNGVKDFSKTAVEIHLYPNPGIDQLQITYQSLKISPISVSIYNIGGQLLATEEVEHISTHQTIDLSSEILNLPQGIFTIIIEQSGMKYPVKWVKN